MVKRCYIHDYPENFRGNTETRTIASDFIWPSMKSSLTRREKKTHMYNFNRDINRAKIFSNEIYIICPFLRKHSDALLSAKDIYSLTNIAVERGNWQKLKKLIICAAKADKTYVNLL